MDDMDDPPMPEVTRARTDVARRHYGDGAGDEFTSACAGPRLIQVPRYRVASELASDALVEVLTDFPPSPLPVHVPYSHTRQLSPRLRVFFDWLVQKYRTRDAD